MKIDFSPGFTEFKEFLITNKNTKFSAT